MTNYNRLQFKCFKLFITLLYIILSPNTSFADTKSYLIHQQITTCAKNSQGSIIFSFEYSNNNKPQVEDYFADTSKYELVNSSGDTYDVKLMKTIEDDPFSFNIILDTTQLIQINGTFIKLCDNSPKSSKSTIIIAFLASLCLILFTALALTLIILRRKKPITFKFGQKEEEDIDRKEFSDNFEENHFENQNKSQSIDVKNNILINESNSLEIPRTLQPRKSSLKPSKNLTDQLNNNFSAHENGAFTAIELEVVDEINEDKIEEKIEEKPNLPDTRRKSIVTFSETTHVKYG